MKYEFESFSDTYMILAIIIGTSISLLSILAAISLIDLVPFLKSYDKVVIISIIVLALLVLWILGRRFLRQKSVLTLRDNNLIIQRKKFKKELPISDIESYKYKLVNGVRLIIWTRYNERISITANDTFCDYEQLEEFCVYFDKYVDLIRVSSEASVSNISVQDARNHNTSHQESTSNQVIEDLDLKTFTPSESEAISQKVKKSVQNRIPERKKSFYERKYALPVLVTFTVAAVIFIIYVNIDGGSLQGTFIAGLAGILAMWGGYYRHKKK